MTFADACEPCLQMRSCPEIRPVALQNNRHKSKRVRRPFPIDLTCAVGAGSLNVNYIFFNIIIGIIGVYL